jgi:IS5 family transposase
MQAEYVWEELYQAAVIGTDYKELPERIRAAKAATDERLHDLQADHGGTHEERHAISDSLAGLNGLRHELERRSRTTG